MESRSTHQYNRRKNNGKLAFKNSSSYNLPTSHSKKIFSNRRDAINIPNRYLSGKKSLISRRDFFKGAGIIGGVYLVGKSISWAHSAKIVVNGQEMHVKPGSSIDSVINKLDIKCAKGNYVSVSGKILKKDQGYEWGAIVNNKEINPDDNYAIKDKDVIKIVNGRNILEPHDVDYKLEEPKLVFSGSKAGTLQLVTQWPHKGKKELLTGKETGEKAPGKVIEKLQDLIITTANINPEGDDKYICLTFDDGPSEFTQQYLNILKEKQVKATFFCLGQHLDEYPELAKAIVDGGHQIASHTYHHYDLSTLDQKAFTEEMTSTMKAIKTHAGVTTNVLRPPYGSFNTKCWYESKGDVFMKVLWTHDTLDWKQPGASVIVQRATDNPYNGCVILMHDGGGPRDQDVEALPTIIDTLKEQGFKLVTLSEMLSHDPSFSKEAVKGYFPMPKDATWPKEEAKK